MNKFNTESVLIILTEYFVRNTNNWLSERRSLFLTPLACLCVQLGESFNDDAYRNQLESLWHSFDLLLGSSYVEIK